MHWLVCTLLVVHSPADCRYCINALSPAYAYCSTSKDMIYRWKNANSALFLAKFLYICFSRHFQMTVSDQIVLTLFYPWGGHYGPPYHESVCRCCLVRAMLTKLPDFVPFHICQVPESHFGVCFSKN